MYLIWIRRVARIWKKGGGGGLKEWDNCKTPWPEFSLLLNQIHKVYLKLRRIFRLKSKFKRFSAQNRWSPKKGLHWNWDIFFCRDRKFKRFFRPKTGDLRRIFRPRSEISHDSSSRITATLHTSAPKSLRGGLFLVFQQKSASKAPKTCDFAYLQANGGGLGSPSPPPPPTWLRYWHG